MELWPCPLFEQFIGIWACQCTVTWVRQATPAEGDWQVVTVSYCRQHRPVILPASHKLLSVE